MSQSAVLSRKALVASKESFHITHYHLRKDLPDADITNLVCSVGFENVKAVRNSDGSFKIYGLHAEGQAALDAYMA